MFFFNFDSSLPRRKLLQITLIRTNSNTQSCVNTLAVGLETSVHSLLSNNSQKIRKTVPVSRSLCLRFLYDCFLSLSENLLRPWGLRGRERSRRWCEQRSLPCSPPQQMTLLGAMKEQMWWTQVKVGTGGVAQRSLCLSVEVDCIKVE